MAMLDLHLGDPARVATCQVSPGNWRGIMMTYQLKEKGSGHVAGITQKIMLLHQEEQEQRLSKCYLQAVKPWLDTGLPSCIFTPAGHGREHSRIGGGGMQHP